MSSFMTPHFVCIASGWVRVDPEFLIHSEHKQAEATETAMPTIKCLVKALFAPTCSTSPLQSHSETPTASTSSHLGTFSRGLPVMEKPKPQQSRLQPTQKHHPGETSPCTLQPGGSCSTCHATMACPAQSPTLDHCTARCTASPFAYSD